MPNQSGYVGTSLGGAPSAPPTRDAQGNVPTTGGGQYDLGGGSAPPAAYHGVNPESSYQLGTMHSMLGGSAQGGALDLGLAARERDQNQTNSTGQSYGHFNTEALGQYNGGANDMASRYSSMGQQAQGRRGEQMVNQYNGADRLLMQGAQGQQQDALDQLKNAAYGNAPSQAQIQMQQGLDQSLAGQIAAANSTRGGGANMALAQRNAASGGYQMQNQIAGQSAALRANEMAQARGAYSNAADSYRAANQTGYGADQQAAFQQAGLNAGQRAQNDQMQMGYEGMGLQGLTAQQNSDTAKYGADRNVSIANSQQAASNTNAGISAGAATLGAIGLMASDARLKTDISSDSPRVGPGDRARGEADAFLASLHPSSYEYKDSADEPGMGSGGGRYLGVMAQDVEKGPTGSTLVRDTPRGKMLDVPANLSAALGGIGRLHERIKELEAMKGKK